MPKTFIIKDIGVTTKKKTIAINIGDIILPILIPNLNQTVFKGDKILELINPNTRNDKLRINGQIFISPLANSG